MGCHLIKKSQVESVAHTFLFVQNTEYFSFIPPYTGEHRRSNLFTISHMTSTDHITIKWISRIVCPAHTLSIFSMWILIFCLWNIFQWKIRGKSKSGFCLDFEMRPQGRSLLFCHHPCSLAQKFSQTSQNTYANRESKRRERKAHTQAMEIWTYKTKSEHLSHSRTNCWVNSHKCFIRKCV